MKALTAVLVASASVDVPAVYLNPDGLGQALIYPYYTVRSQDNNAFNTYLAVANTTSDAKVVRVRLREGRNGREALNFNLYLSPNDMWTGAMIPTDDGGAALLSTDSSCTNPPMIPIGTAGAKQFVLGNAAFAGANSDGRGDGLDRTREGYVEMIEMATLAGAAAAAVTHNPGSGVPANCPSVQGPTVPLAGVTAPPSGGLMGTLTLINVALGQDSTVNAEALHSLSTESFYRNIDSAYPDFDAAEVTPVSEVTAGGKRYRLTWSRGVDAVSSVMMQSATTNEYVLDTNTASLTDWVSTMPTRRFYRTATTASAPFTVLAGSPECDVVDWTNYNRETRTATVDYCGGYDPCPGGPPPPIAFCWAATVWPVVNAASHMRPLFGSANTLTGAASAGTGIPVTDTFQNGWARITYSGAGAATGLTSLPSSSAMDLATGASVAGRFRVVGLPIVGFFARTFSNGTITCEAGSCQGNYGSAFPHHAIRSVVPAP